MYIVHVFKILKKFLGAGAKEIILQHDNNKQMRPY